MAKTRMMQIVILQIISFLLNTFNLKLGKALKDLRSRIKRLMKNEYSQTILLLVIVVIGIAGFQLGLRVILRTDYPLAVVESESMVPTLNIGDIIVIQGVPNADEIHAASKTANPPGDIIIFYDHWGRIKRVYWFFTTPVLIVHRAVGTTPKGDFITQGDNNPSRDPWEVKEANIVGRVVFRIPWLGHISLFMQSDLGFLTIICLMVALIAIEYLLSGKEKGGEPKEAKAL